MSHSRRGAELRCSPYLLTATCAQLRVIACSFNGAQPSRMLALREGKNCLMTWLQWGLPE